MDKEEKELLIVLVVLVAVLAALCVLSLMRCIIIAIMATGGLLYAYAWTFFFKQLRKAAERQEA